MPIRASEKARYPKDWRAISARIRERSGGQCECPGGDDGCGLHHGRRCEERHGEPAKWANGRVVFTTMHLDHTPENVADNNLRAACQRCHLRYDRAHHAETSAATRRAKSPQIPLMEPT